jgi:anti-sigma factor RsiW
MSRFWPFGAARRTGARPVLGDVRLPRRRKSTDGGAGQISEAKLHAYVDGALGGADRLNVEAFLALRPDIAARVDAYRSQTVALHAAFATGEEEGLPPSVADLTHRFSRARATSVVIAVVLVSAGGIAILLAALNLMD